MRKYLLIGMILLATIISACQTLQLSSQVNLGITKTFRPISSKAESSLDWRLCMDETPGADDMTFDGEDYLWLSWLGTGDNPQDIVRLNPLNGRSTRYNAQNGPHETNVLVSSMARDGTVWFSAYDSIVQFDGKNWQNYHDLPLAAAYTDVAVAPNGDLWVGTIGPKDSGQGVFRFDGKTWIPYTTKDGLADNNVYQVEISSDGVVWLGTNAGVSRWDGERWYTYAEMEGFPVEDMVIAADGVIWLTSGESIFRFDGNAWTNIYTMPDCCSSSIEIAPDGTVWLRYPKMIAYLDADDNWTVYQTPIGVLADDQDYIRSIAVAQNGVLWLSTGNGVFCVER